MLAIECVRPKTNAMPKHRVDIIIATYEGLQVDWGIIVDEALKGGIMTLNKIPTIMAQWLMILL